MLLLAACAQADGERDPPAEGAAGSGALLSEAEWLELTAPRPGVHEVYSAACGGERIAQEYPIVPSVACYVRRDASGNATSSRDCVVEDSCTSSSDCRAQPGGVCRGWAGSSCEYPGFGEAAPCEQDTDCGALPGGRCMPRIEAGGEYCYPTGECQVTPLAGCVYPGLYAACASDADCTAAPGGACRHLITSTECAYNECDDAADCGPAARCECQAVRRCVPAACFSDSDCSVGHRCEASLELQCGNLRPPAGYHCHGVDDECQSDADCAGPSCVFDPAVEHWACRDNLCWDR